MSKKNWQKSLQKSIFDYGTLLKYLSIDQNACDGLYAQKSFPLKVTREYASRIKKGDLSDPLLRQILPVTEELNSVPGYTVNPLCETESVKVPGLMHKYHGRVLVTITGACAIHCRYCFRQHFPYEANTPSRAGWEKIVNYILSDTSISEVIYSGGDPLMAKDSLLAELTNQLAEINHVKRLRIHTRLPVVLPQRICSEFFDWLDDLQLQKVIVLHINHPNEIDESVGAAIEQLNEHGITVLNQSVLLRGVNNSAKVLAELSEKLFSYGAMPYYLHLLDKVHGAAHFDVDLQEAQAIYAELRKLLSGFLLPKLVREVPGELSKIPIL